MRCKRPDRGKCRADAEDQDCMDDESGETDQTECLCEV